MGKQCTLAWRSRLERYRLGPPVQHQIGLLVERVFTLDQLARRVQKGRQFIHAVINHRAWRQVAGQLQRHLRVAPDQVVVDTALLDEVSELALQHRQVVVMKARYLAGQVAVKQSRPLPFG